MRGKISRVAAIVRAYNNPHVAEHVTNLLNISVGRIVVVTDKTRDNGVTPRVLSDIRDARLAYHEMEQGYSWANALNIALRSIQMENWDHKSRGMPPLDFIFPVSVEARVSTPHVEAMLDEITDSRRFAMVGTSFAGEAGGNPIDLGISYTLPRNTAAMISLDTFQCGIGGFDPHCDQEGGMEDMDLLIGLYAITGKAAGLKMRMLDLRIPLVVGVHHDQRKKEERERLAIEKIIARWRAGFRPGSMERERVEDAISELESQSHMAA